MTTIKVDWDEGSEDTVTCFCDARWRSQTKLIRLEGRFRLLAKRACPSCQSQFVRQATSDPESFTVARNK